MLLGVGQCMSLHSWHIYIFTSLRDRENVYQLAEWSVLAHKCLKTCYHGSEIFAPESMNECLVCLGPNKKETPKHANSQNLFVHFLFVRLFVCIHSSCLYKTCIVYIVYMYISHSQ